MSEAVIQQSVRLALGQCPAVRMFRNNVGAIKAPDGRVIRYGLTTGSADLIGWQTVIITPEMVGLHIARFVSIEVKAPKGRLTHEQQVWADNVRKAGGIAVIARSVEDVQFLVA